LPCVARPTFVLVQRTKLAAKESTGKPTTSFNHFPFYSTRTLSFTGKNYKLLHFTGKKFKTIYTI
jgi:hypothetical protein